jgi:hypothetical protein
VKAADGGGGGGGEGRTAAERATTTSIGHPEHFSACGYVLPGY